jgi:hypothetical protein
VIEVETPGRGVNPPPFLIFGIDYTPSSAGIRAVHLLCHNLRRRGVNALLTPCVQNPDIDTKILYPGDAGTISGAPFVAVYPEGVQGNPLCAPVVARWLLYPISHKFYSMDDLFFSWSSYYNIEGIECLPLIVPVIDESIFRDTDSPRSGYCYYANKFIMKGGIIPDEISRNGINLSDVPRGDHKQLASILNTSEYIICFEESTITTEAAMCGCPTVFYKSEYLTYLPHVADDGESGVSVSTEKEAIGRARDTLHVEIEAYRKNAENTVHLIDRFIDVCSRKSQEKLNEVGNSYSIL